jgi:LysM repeat protein
MMAMEYVDSPGFLYRPKLMQLGVWLVKSVLIIVLAVGMLIIYDWHSSVSAQGVIIHIVQPGENLSSIARRYGVGVGELASYNGITNANLIRVGQSLRIPSKGHVPRGMVPANDSVPSPTPPTGEIPNPTPTPPHAPSSTSAIYTVRPNDTLFGIAKRFGVSVEAIKLRNGLHGDVIRVGQRLIIP